MEWRLLYDRIKFYSAYKLASWIWESENTDPVCTICDTLRHWIEQMRVVNSLQGIETLIIFSTITFCKSLYLWNTLTLLIVSLPSLTSQIYHSSFVWHSLFLNIKESSYDQIYITKNLSQGRNFEISFPLCPAHLRPKNIFSFSSHISANLKVLSR